MLVSACCRAVLLFLPIHQSSETRMHIHVAQSAEKQLVGFNKVLGQVKVVYTDCYACIHTQVCWYSALSCAGISSEKAEGFPLSFLIATAPMAPVCLFPSHSTHGHP